MNLIAAIAVLGAFFPSGSLKQHILSLCVCVYIRASVSYRKSHHSIAYGQSCSKTCYLNIILSECKNVLVLLD